MTQESPAIEVEVLAIDGAAPPAPAGQPSTSSRPLWHDMRSRMLRLDGRWWPLWLALGAVALVLLLTVGLVVGLVYLILRLIQGILKAVIR